MMCSASSTTAATSAGWRCSGAGGEVAHLVDHRGQPLLRVDDDVGELDQLRIVGHPALQRLGVADQRELLRELVGDAGDHAADRGELLGLHQPLGRGAELAMRRAQLGGGALDLAGAVR
jgi:hypothetical protein